MRVQGSSVHLSQFGKLDSQTQVSDLASSTSQAKIIDICMDNQDVVVTEKDDNLMNVIVMHTP